LVPNVLLITVDDLGSESVGAYGSKVPDVTPHIDRLAREGALFEHAHVNIAICQPSRAVLMTGLYPHRNGAMGFEPIRADVPTLFERMKEGGYHIGIMSKLDHTAASRSEAWDAIVRTEDLNGGRDAAAYHRHALSFFEQAHATGKPFLLVANVDDPHLPFAGTEFEALAVKRRMFGLVRAPPQSSRVYGPEEIAVPGFLPDLPAVRQDLAAYYASVHRADESVGAILRALDEAGLRESTLVVLLSDNGMPFPFAKTNVYQSSTRTPWIVRWPGVVEAGRRDTTHVVSAVDFAPTVLEAAGQRPFERVDGRSFLPLLRGEEQSGRDHAFTFMHVTKDLRRFPMRAVVGRRFGYIYNAWSDGASTFRNRTGGMATMLAMREAAQTDSALAARLAFLDHRTPEELYDYAADPAALWNLVDEPEARETLSRLRGQLQAEMEAKRDPILERFEARLREAPSEASE
jgi:N-sulfoglucosamine sulfohydrolase